MPQTILNVEDVQQNRDLIRRILESEGYRVVDAVSALEGIAMAKSIEPALILMDINLPDLDGFTAVTRLRSFPHINHVPIVAITARTVSNDRERARAIGCDGYLNKPIDFDELVSAVAHHIKKGHVKSDVETKREQYLQEQNVSLIVELEQKFSELQAAYDRLKQFEEAKSDFISVVSHELRTPLTVIHSYTQMLEMLPVIQGDQHAKDLLAGVARGFSRLQDIVEDMVSVIRVELADTSFDYTLVSIRSILSSVKTEQTPNAKARNIELIAEAPEGLPVVHGDSKQLHSALSRIVSNGIKYTPDNGKVSIHARHLPKNDKDSLSFIEVIVTDTGVGINRDKQKLIFDKFSTASNVALHSTSKTEFMGGGAGLGLTIARGVIEAHHGRIWVESPGHDPETLPGSKFYILLPTQED
ncbi:hybrid sensor histidine kinase/response regulator [Anaerolineales bacterium HSG25]|nr:hybrid sensor histidine kinase/response regulator [Anaerolineales bacterium HSG25]